MVGRYDICDVRMAESGTDSLLRNVRLRAGPASSDRISKCMESTVDIRTAETDECRGALNECYLDTPLSFLRELSGDRETQYRYALSASGFVDRSAVNVLIVKLRVRENEELADSDYAHLNSLLTCRSNDVYVMPIVEFDGRSRTEKVECYDGFVRRMLEEKASWAGDINVGMSIPRMYPRSMIGDLFDIYSDERPTFVSVDLDNGRLVRPGDLLGPVLGHFEREKEEKVFLHAVNAKPFERVEDRAPAWDVYLAHCSFNAVGPARSDAHLKALIDGWERVNRVFDPDSVRHCVADDRLRERFMAWLDENYDLGFRADFDRHRLALYPYLRRYNFQMSNGVLRDLSTAVCEGDERFIGRMVEAMPGEMKGADIRRAVRRARRSDATA